MILNYVEFILKQDVDSSESSKGFLVIRIISFLIALFFSFGLYYLLDEYVNSKVLKIIIFVYAALAFFTTMPAKTIQMREDDDKLAAWIPNFGFYNSLSTLVAPIYLFKYCLALEKDKENNN